MNSIRGCESMFNYGATAFGSFITIPKVDSIGNVIKNDENQDIYNIDNKNSDNSKNELFTIYNKRIIVNDIEHFPVIKKKK